MSELQDHIENCDCRLVSCPNDCGGKFLQRGIPNHLATRCPKKLVTTSAPVATSTIIETSKPTLPVSQPPSTIPPNGKVRMPKVLQSIYNVKRNLLQVECKFCDDEIEVSKVDDHEQKYVCTCFFLMLFSIVDSVLASCDWKPKRCQHCNMVVISRDLLRHETSCKTNVKSCSHCNENMPQSALTTHGSRCSKRPIKCIRCCQLFPADTIVAHSTNCKAPIKIPPPPPFPPPSTSTTPVSTPPPTRRSSADSPAKVEETASDRLARRNLVLSQLTNPSVTPTSSPRASAPSLQLSGLQSRPIIQPDGRDHVETEAVEDEEDDDEVYGDEDDNELTLAQVVKEWSVENVCLWLHEDVGVPGVVLRFQQKQCNGEMLLELTESDLINDFGVKDRVQRERILSAIEAINTSTFSDEDENDDEDENSDEDLEESEGYEATSSSPSSHIRNSIGAASFGHPRDILRRKSQPSPQKLLGGELPSSNDMLRRISNALESPKALAGTSSTHLIG
ncbi:Liprin-beta-2 [Phytophthora citrophthora]|uniref:Liprin-beta-2 n=1 Tax=Phytophthora citrophthora TaxID=4793 RepID=A0AAD9G624_9STRA|nr:Liprin-beta-2 [Phytophthora citrophthora]